MPKWTVVIEAQSGLKDDDYLKNKSITDSDNRCVYRFDCETGRLEGLKMYLREKGRDVLIFEVTKIEYNRPIDRSIFSLELPKDVVFLEDPKELPDNEEYARMTPKETARAFFEACAQEDWEEFGKFMTVALDDRLKKILGGLEVIRIGEPFQSGGYGGWFVPYEIKFKGSSRVRKHNLAVRNDNPAKRYVVDGGI